jgi:hypothetical protein
MKHALLTGRREDYDRRATHISEGRDEQQLIVALLSAKGEKSSLERGRKTPSRGVTLEQALVEVTARIERCELALQAFQAWQLDPTLSLPS